MKLKIEDISKRVRDIAADHKDAIKGNLFLKLPASVLPWTVHLCKEVAKLGTSNDDRLSEIRKWSVEACQDSATDIRHDADPKKDADRCIPLPAGKVLGSLLWLLDEWDAAEKQTAPKLDAA